eukprot:12399274-Karenia_brevis.AAC.1
MVLMMMMVVMMMMMMMIMMVMTRPRVYGIPAGGCAPRSPCIGPSTLGIQAGAAPPAPTA